MSQKGQSVKVLRTRTLRRHVTSSPYPVSDSEPDTPKETTPVEEEQSQSTPVLKTVSLFILGVSIVAGIVGSLINVYTEHNTKGN